MWLGENHKEALATLRYGILDNKGFLLLTGDVGTGKTTLINALIGSLTNDVVYASVPDPSLDKMDFFNYIAAAFGLGSEFATKGKFLSSFTSFLHKAYENNKKVLLIIDESQLLSQELLEEVRLLSNIVTKDSNPLLNIFFVGQYEFNELIRRPENRAIAQRLTLNYYIEPLTLEETGEYVRHRLKIAGTTEEIFNTSAIKEIYASSQGFPRKINILCDHCLMSGYADEKKVITSSIVKESAGELQIPVHRKGQIGQGQSSAQQSGKTMKASWSWPVLALLLLFGLLLSGSYYFLYYTNERFKEATAHLTTLQDKTGVRGVESSGANMVPEKTPGPVQKAPDPVQKTSQTTSATTSDKIGAGSIPVDKVKVQPVVLAENINASGNKKTVQVPSVALPKDPLMIRFKYDSNLFSMADIERMKEFASVVKLHPEASVNIFGYTDSSGDQEYNLKLSEFRANMVRSFLMGQELSPEKLRAQGFGNSNPIDTNDTEEGRTMNRRVEISVVAKE